MFIEIVAIKEQGNVQFAINMDEICLIKSPGTLRRVTEESTFDKEDYYVVDAEVIFKNGRSESIMIRHEEFTKFLAMLEQEKGMIPYFDILFDEKEVEEDGG